MPYESPGHNHAIHIGAVAHVQEHVRYTSCRRLLKGRKHAPYAVYFLFHLFFLFPYQITRFRIVYLRRLVFQIAGTCESYIPELVDHVTLRVPVLVLAITEDLDKLLKNCRLTSVALLGKLGGIVVVAVNLAIVFVVAVLGTEHGRAERAGEVVDVVLAL